MSDYGISREEFEALLRELTAVRGELKELQSKIPLHDGLTEETLQVIAAAVAAYFGKRATFRVIRKVEDSDEWTLQGRAALQGSHAMPHTRGVHL